LLPFSHLAPKPSKMVAPAFIPVVDLAPYLAADATAQAKEQVVTAICEAARTYGFFSITGHGIPLKDQDTTLECAKRFFDLPVEEKTSVFIGNAMGSSNRGYEVFKGQTLEPGTLPDMKEVSANQAVMLSELKFCRASLSVRKFRRTTLMPAHS
jgi:isopenicillin N synthase-like dioxygenase